MSLLEDLLIRCRKHRKLLLLAVLIPCLVSVVLSLLLPKMYLSRASVLPANGRLADKLRLSGEEISLLYSAYGDGDDLDRIYAMANSGNLLWQIADSLKLVDHYGLSQKETEASELAIRKLKRNSKLKRSPYGELQVMVWDRDPNMAANIANGYIRGIEQKHLEQYRILYAQTLSEMQAKLATMQAGADSSAASDSAVIEAYRKSITAFTLAANHPPPSLMVVEKAAPALRADRPMVWLNLSVTLLLSLFCALAVLLLRTQNPPTNVNE